MTPSGSSYPNDNYPNTKFCPYCKIDLPIDNFGKNKTRHDNLASLCKKCMRQIDAKRRNALRLKRLESTTRKCKQCNYILPNNDFGKHVHYLLWTCKRCVQSKYDNRLSKKCCTCRRVLPVGDFHRASKPVDGRMGECKQCKSISIRKQKGLPHGWYENALSAQGCKCAICGTENSGGHGTRGKTSFHVDHNHACCPTNRYCIKCARGLLCNRCNNLLGHIENETWILKALSYLHLHGSLKNLCWVGECRNDSIGNSDTALCAAPGDSR